MKFHEHKTASANTFSAHGKGYVEVNGHRYEQSIFVAPGEPVVLWPVKAIAEVNVETVAAALAWKPDILIIGSGSRFAFPPVEALKALRALNCAIEVMDTKAACRTYNVLVSEDRNVAAAIIIDGG